MAEGTDETTVESAILSGDRRREIDALFVRAARGARGFSELEVGWDDTVALMLRNDFPFFEASMAANLLGAHAVPINWHFQAREAGYILRDSGARALVVHADLLPQIESALEAVEEDCDRQLEVLVVETPPEVLHAYGIDPSLASVPEGRRGWAEWLEGFEPRAEQSPPPPSSMIYTSGTTGHPKGVRREPFTEESGARFTDMVTQIFGLAEGSGFRTVVTGPMYHSAPNAYGLFAARNRGFCVLQPRFDPLELLELVERHRISHLHMVPTMFVRLLKLSDEEKSRHDLSSLEFVVHAAAPCPPEVKRRMIEWWGPVIHEYYGATETGGVVFHDSEEALRKPGTVGRPIEGGHVRIYDESGQVLGPNRVGEVYLAIDGFPDFTYNGLPEKRDEVGRDGMVTAGDVGYLDEDGYLFLCDRKKDMVISGGVNIYPAEIEAELIDMPGVQDCAVFGIPDEEFGEALCAHVEPEAGVSLDASAVRTWLGERLARYKVPKVVELASELPREDSGKIFKRKLRAPYWEDAGRQI